MTAKEIINEIINNDDKFKTIQLNTRTNKIEVEREEILSIDYDDIMDLCKSQYPDTKFTKSTIKDIVTKYAREHKYEPVKESQPKSEWYSKLEFDGDGNVIKNLDNVIRFYENHPNFKDKFFYNEFTSYETFDGELIRDYNISEFRVITERELGFESKDKIECAVQYLTHRNSFNPFKDSINELLWDGEERFITFFIKFIGVHDTPLNRSMTRKWFYAMMKRLYEPGCPFDNMLIIYDAKQGTGKSKIIQRLVESLGLNYGYDTSISCDNKDKDNVDKLNRTWIVGIDEMQEFLKKNPEQTKQFLAQTFDTARLSYARRSEQYLRHCVFYGNSNLEYFLKDYTSNFERRYWVMEADGEVHDKEWWDNNLTDEYCQQVLAEIKYFYDNNPDFNYTTLSVEESEQLAEVQYRHKTLNNDELLQYNILKILDKLYPHDELRDYEQFCKYANDDLIIKETEVTSDFFGENTDRSSAVKIDKIPVKWVKMYVEKYFNRSVSTQYITALILKQWSYKAAKYNGKTTNCYIRYKNPDFEE